MRMMGSRILFGCMARTSAAGGNFRGQRLVALWDRPGLPRGVSGVACLTALGRTLGLCTSFELDLTDFAEGDLLEILVHPAPARPGAPGGSFGSLGGDQSRW